MEIQELYKNAIQIIERYGRPPSLSAHLRKLGEEVGELGEAVSQYSFLHLTTSAARNDALKAVQRECIDVILVTISLLEMANGHLEQELKDKLKELETRIGCDRLDKRYGSQAITSYQEGAWRHQYSEEERKKLISNDIEDLRHGNIE